MQKDKFYLEHFDIHVGTMSLDQLDRLIKQKQAEKMQMKQELLRRKHSNDIHLEKKIRKEINMKTLQILLDRAKDSRNEEVMQLYARLKALKQYHEHQG